MKLNNLLLIGSIVISVIFSSCKKNEDDSSTPSNDPIETTGTFTDSRDGKIYKWVKIGEQIWMAENLAYTGSDIQHITDNNEWDNNDYNGWCYYNNSDSLGQIYGVLYQWHAAKTACPSGWHIPTNDEWTKLKNYLIENGYSYDGVIGNHGIAKSLATDSGWLISDNQGAVGNSDFSEYRNKTGFSALPSGNRTFNGSFDGLSHIVFFWSTDECCSYGSYCNYLNYSTEKVTYAPYEKVFGYSVRCIRD